MEPEGSLPHSQDPATCPYPEPIYTVRFPSRSLKISSDIFLPFTSSSSKWSLPLRLTQQNPICSSPLPRTCYMPNQFD